MSPSQETLRLAAQNIVQAVGHPPSESVLVVYSQAKENIAESIMEVLEGQEREPHLLKLGARLDASAKDLRSLIKGLARSWGVILLIQPEHASFLVETVGRPDFGIKIPVDHVFCDWTIQPCSLIRTYGIDMDELHQFRQSLLSELSGAGEIHVTTELGTDIAVIPRDWNITDGEIYTAPIEEQASGPIYVDGCAYYGPPEQPFALRIQNGRVVNLSELSESDEQQRMARYDLTRDEGSSVLAELGIGINPGAKWDVDVMEAEQARGTCHFGFGHNIEYGGQNKSSYHFDLVIQKPTIEVDGRIICGAGQYRFGQNERR